ncbi:MAG: GDP-mannose 4,6-dehydratase [Flavobacteriaceae bacterium]|nr:GDP-mannose 4,6-dehydratase [Flavobacteriaceae bacterium]
MKNFLITGGAGFIGSHLTQKLLKQGHRVVVLDNFHEFYDYQIKLKNLSEAISFYLVPKSDSKQKDIQAFAKQTKTDFFELIYGDIRDEELLGQIFENEKFHLVIHLAALAGVRPSIQDPIEYESVNIKGSMQVFENCKIHQVKKIICASSSSVYGNNEKIPFAETDVVDFAISPYAATKKAVEVMGHVYHKLYEIDMIQLRFFTVYGPRQRPDLAIHKFASLLQNHQELPFYGDGTTSRDYTYIDDIIDGVYKSIIYLLQHEKIYEIINLGENEVISLQKMVETLELKMKMKAKLKRLPLQAGDVNKTNADISKAKKLLGYEPKTNFELGIEKFVNWLRNNNS